METDIVGDHGDHYLWKHATSTNPLRIQSLIYPTVFHKILKSMFDFQNQVCAKPLLLLQISHPSFVAPAQGRTNLTLTFVAMT